MARIRAQCRAQERQERTLPKSRSRAVKAAREVAPEMGVAAEYAGLYGFMDCFPAVRLLYALSLQQECPTCSFP